MNHDRYKRKLRRRRRFRVRKRVRGNAERPRLTVFRSNQHIYAQVVDDFSGRTLVSASTVDRELRKQISYGGNSDAAVVVGTAIAERAKQSGISNVAFDRGHCKYHGRVGALAQAAREAGLEF